MGVLDDDEYQRWRTQAEDTLAFARTSASASPAWTCFLSEQAAQFATKGFLHGVGEAAWGHDLAALLAAAETTAPELQSARAAAWRLARHYIAARYPDAHPGGIPTSRYSDDDAAGALADAEAVLAALDLAWRALGDDGP